MPPRRIKHKKTRRKSRLRGGQSTSIVVSTIAGNNAYWSPGYKDAKGLDAQFGMLNGITLDPSGNVIISEYSFENWYNDTFGNHIRKITPDGMVSTIMDFKNPMSVLCDKSGNIFVAGQDNLIKKRTPGGAVTTFSVVDTSGAPYSFVSPRGMVIDNNGNLFVIESNFAHIRKVTPQGVTTIFAGNAQQQGFADGTGQAAKFSGLLNIAVDTMGNVYTSETTPNHRIRKITPGGVVTTLAGNGTAGFADGTGGAAIFNNPNGLAVDGSGNVFVADLNNNRIRKITPDGVVTTLAGKSQYGVKDGNELEAEFYAPVGVTIDSINGILYVADQGGSRIKKITGAVIPTPTTTRRAATTTGRAATTTGRAATTTGRAATTTRQAATTTIQALTNSVTLPISQATNKVLITSNGVVVASVPASLIPAGETNIIVGTQ